MEILVYYCIVGHIIIGKEQSLYLTYISNQTFYITHLLTSFYEANAMFYFKM